MTILRQNISVFNCFKSASRNSIWTNLTSEGEKYAGDPEDLMHQLVYSQILNLEHLMINGHTHGLTSWFFCRRYYHSALPYLFDIWVVRQENDLFGYFENWLYLPVGTLHFPKPPPGNFLLKYFNMMNTLKLDNSKLNLTQQWMTMTCCQDHILTENIWFVWSETSYSGDERRCYRCGTTNNNKWR